MKRVNLILETDLYEKARAIAFIRRKSISEIVRCALGEWLNKNVDSKARLLISERDETRLLKILGKKEFLSSEEVKKSLGL